MKNHRFWRHFFQKHSHLIRKGLANLFLSSLVIITFLHADPQFGCVDLQILVGTLPERGIHPLSVTVDTRQPTTGQGPLAPTAKVREEIRFNFNKQRPLVPFLEKKAVPWGLSALPSVEVCTATQMFLPLDLSQT